MTCFRHCCCLFPGVLANALIHSAVQEGVDGTAAAEAPIQSQVWPFQLLSRHFSFMVLHARAQTLSSQVISSTSVNKEQAPGFLQVASAIGLYYKLATEKGNNCIGGLVCVGFCFKLSLVLQY